MRDERWPDEDWPIELWEIADALWWYAHKSEETTMTGNQEVPLLRQYTVYLNPTDLAVKGYAVREWRIGRGRIDPGPVLADGLASLDAAREVVPPWADACLPRSPDDDPTIVEVWM